MEIRLANENDAQAIRKIYEPYVTDTAVTFEYEVPSVDEFKRRINNTLEKYPYLVLIEDGVIVGYAYAGAFRTREAYKHSAELSVYLDMNCRRKGYGSYLYQKLQEILYKQNIYTIHACITNKDGSDEHVTNDSELFHSRMGFEFAGKHKNCGYKFGKWYNIIWMDKVLRDVTDTAEKFIPFPELLF